MQANVTSVSQAYKVREYGEKAGIRHGQTVRADLRNVRVVAVAGRNADIFFCGMSPIRVREVLVPGDGGSLPGNVALDGVEFPGSGEFDIISALISANGDLRISADRENHRPRELAQARPHLAGLRVHDVMPGRA